MSQASGSLPVYELLERIYGGDEATRIAAAIERLTSDYEARLDDVDRSSGLSEQDVMLIAYGDSLNETGTPPLKVFERFYRTHLEGSFSLVHILPFHPFTSDDGFSVVDFYAVREDLGTWQDIRAIARDCRLMADAVINHVSSKSTWFRGYLDGDPRYEDFFLDMDPDADLSDVVRPRTTPLLTAIPDAGGKIRYIWTTFSADQVDLNYSNPDVLLAVIEVLFFLVSQGARLLRLDAVTFLWKEPGTSSANMDETHALIKIMRAAIEGLCRDVVVITETNVPHRENIAYFGNGHDEAHMVYNFALPPLLAHSFLSGDSTRLSEWAASLSLPGSNACFLNFSASHDGVGVRPVEEILDRQDLDALVAAATSMGGMVSYRSSVGEDRPYELNCTYLDLISLPGEPEDVSAKRFIASQAIVLAMPGVPAIYIQSLLGNRNDVDGVRATGRARSVNRTQHDAAQVTAELDDPATLRAQIFKGITRLIAARCGEAAFSPSAGFEILRLDKRVFAVTRYASDSNDSITALVNLTGESLNVAVAEDGEGTDTLTDDRVALQNVSLDAYAVRWLRPPGSHKTHG